MPEHRRNGKDGAPEPKAAEVFGPLCKLGEKLRRGREPPVLLMNRLQQFLVELPWGQDRAAPELAE
ncbi:MAG: hypothetical protein WBF17_24580 [Phycisphaerae bacterium]